MNEIMKKELSDAINSFDYCMSFITSDGFDVLLNFKNPKREIDGILNALKKSGVENNKICELATKVSKSWKDMEKNIEDINKYSEELIACKKSTMG